MADDLPGPIFTPGTSSLVSLPRTLARPAFREINRDALASVEPELRDVPVEYVKRHIAQQAGSMVQALSAASSSVPQSLPKARIPKSFQVAASPSAPTHVLALASASQSSSNITLIPTHHLVLAIHCSHMPSLPASKPGSGSVLVVPMTVPSASTFPILHNYLYTKRLDTLLNSMVQLPPSFIPSGSSSSSSGLSHISPDAIKRASHHLASSSMYSAEPLMRYVGIVNSMWKNVCALGVFERDLWQAMDIAWEIVLGAVAIVESRK
ncbi:hypothetical protein JAAARDRAFT_139870 [Jaapia argillacea MUCL 33604]|uniref:Clp1-like protein n=1 Tax=Jaapia argillacea MUCL 33604 TaxID=933084 RepID=A0A067PCX0_9AGAM|nr:hypothetical protein JAAARDRAFT_139870 [Jaapia argillacea MUCL 33604]